MDEYFVYGIRIVVNIVGTPCNQKKMQLEERSIFTIYQLDDKELNMQVIELPKIVPDFCWQEPIFPYKVIRLESNLSRKTVEQAVSIDSYSNNLVISTMDRRFIDEHVTMKLTIQ